MRRIYKYSISLLLIIICSTVVASAQDTLLIPLKMRIGLDAYGPITYIGDNNIFQSEGYFSLDLNEKRSVVVNAGFLNYKHSQSDFNYRYDYINRGAFIKTGLDFNLLKTEKAMGKYWAGIGLRYGLSVYNSEIPNIERLNYWGNGSTSVAPGTSMGHFIEASPGVRAEVLRNISIGWTISLRKLISSGAGKDLKPIYMPGYGNTGKSIATGISYFIVWNIPYKKIKVIIKKEEVEEEEDTEDTDSSEDYDNRLDPNSNFRPQNPNSRPAGNFIDEY
jgi:hypothetical protein